LLSVGARRTKPPVWLAFAALPIALICLPLYYVVARSWDSGVGGVLDGLLRPRTFMLLSNTLTLAVCVTVAATGIGIAAAWFVERCDVPGRRAWRVIVSLPLAVPAFVASYAWTSFGSRFEGMAGAILILTLSSYPLVYLPIAAALRNMDRNIEDAAHSLGHNARSVFRRIILPQALPAIGGGALLVLSHMLAEFGALSLLRVQTFTTAIFQEYELQFDNASAALLSTVLLLLCLPVAAGEMWLRRRTRFSKVGRQSARPLTLVSLGRYRIPVLIFFVVLTILALGVPFGSILYWLTHGSSLNAGNDRLVDALRGSLTFALPGALLTTLMAIPLVILSSRHKGLLASFADRLPYVVHGLPGLVVALALVFVSIHYLPLLYQGLVPLMAAYAILFLPLAQSALRASVELVPHELEEAARILGRNSFGAFMAVTLPNIASGVGAALSLIVLELMRELTATLLLAPSGMTTLATELWSYSRDAAYAAAAPFAATIVLISGLPVYVFTMRLLRQTPREQAAPSLDIT
jgi:iron(III) transport system permease protein